MHFEFFKTRILCLYLFLIAHEKVEARNKKWLDHFRRHIKADKEINQVTLITEHGKRNYNPEIDELRNLISAVIPTRKIDFEEARVEEAEKENRLQQVYDPRATLFLIIPSKTDDYLSKLTRPIDFLSLLCRARRRPKVLIILQVRESANYQKLFTFMWPRKFLDVSILELLQEDTITKSSSNHFHEEKTVEVKIHYYLPFTDSFMKMIYSTKIDLFPQKLHNLHNYQMKVGIFHYPPYVFLNRKPTGKIDGYYGPDAECLNALSKALNFKISEKFSSKENWDKANCTKEKNTGLIRDIAYNKINLIAIQAIMISPCMIDIYEQSFGFRPFYYYVAIAPTVPNQVTSLLTEWKIYNTGIIIILVVTAWIFSRILRFDNRNWQFEDIARVVLGWTVPREPRVLAERILFGSMLITCFLHSTFILTALTTINLQKEPDSKVGTEEELLESGLKTFVPENVFDILVSKNENLEGLLKKAMKTHLSDDECVEYLIKFKNITCLMRDSRAHFIVENKRREFGESLVRVVDEFKVMFPASIKFERASPYVQRFDDLALRFRESGIVVKWDEKFIIYGIQNLDQVELLISEFMESTKIQRQIFLLLLFGYLCSFIAFTGEVLVHFYRKVIRRWNG